MYRNKKWFALLLALCMMISLMPAANMENVQIEAVNGIAGDDESIETPTEIEGYVGEVQMTLGGDEEAQNNDPGTESAPGADTTEGDTTPEDQIDAPANVEPEGTKDSDGAIESEGTVEGAADTTGNTDGVEGDAGDDSAAGEETAPSEGEGETEGTAEDAEMFVVAGPVIKTQPKDWQGKVNKTASFTVKATSSKVNYAWEYHKAGATAFKTAKSICEAKSYTEPTLKVKMTKALNGSVFRCKVTFKTADKNTKTKGFTYTDEVVMSSLKIKTQPKDTVAKKVGGNVTLTVATDAKKPSYTWQWHKAGENAFTDVDWVTPTKAKLTVAVTAARNGSVFRCKIYDKTTKVTIYTREATVSVKPFTLKKNPADLEVNSGETAKFAVTKNSSYTYLWEYCTESMPEFKSVTKAMCAKGTTAQKSFKTYQLQLKATDDLNGCLVRCKVTDKNNTVVYSKEAKLTVKTEIVKDNVKYKMIDGVMTVVGYAKAQKSYTVAEKINGEVVKAIGEKAFEGNKTMVSIDLPDTIEVIGKRAFADCTKLSSMT